MRHPRATAVLLFALAMSRSAAAETFVPEDTFINLNHNVAAGLEVLNLYTWPAGSIANAILMRFDLSSAPAGAVVESATLHLFLTEAETSADDWYRVTVHAIVNVDPVIAAADGYTYDGSNPWTPNTCCLNDVPLAQADISAAVADVLMDKTLGEKVFDVTELVQAWLDDPATNRGLLVNSDGAAGADRFRYFGSVENSTPDVRPFLSVTWATGSGEGNPTGATGCAAGEYYDFLAEECRTPSERGCASVPAGAAAALLLLLRRRAHR